MGNADKYQENIISSVNQNEKDEFVYRAEGSKIRVLFVGNSITLHGKLPEAGWNQDCGMAASCLEKDYVHLVVSKIKEKYDPNVTFGILQVANYERRFLEVTPKELYGEILPKHLQADIVIMFFGANTNKDYYTMENPPKTFGQAYEDLRNYLDLGTNTFYHSMGFYIREGLDEAKRAVAEKYGEVFIDIEDIRQRDDTHGRFNHPGDIGMAAIADRFFETIEPKVKEICER